ncbi:MAG TPA: hypothetical protein VH500_20000 [Nitrososphaeraceae archaeon]|jgi:hypothetical protein
MTIQEIDFGKIQKDRISEMKRWVRFVKKAKEVQRDRLNLAIVAANNHYAGFGPGTSNTFRKMLDLSEVTWYDVKVPQAERAACHRSYARFNSIQGPNSPAAEGCTQSEDPSN